MIKNQGLVERIQALNNLKLVLLLIIIGLAGALICRVTNGFAPAISGIIGGLIGIGISIYETRKTPKQFFVFYNRYGRQDKRVFLILGWVFLASLSGFLWELVLAAFR
jgi:hypothetical protein